MKEQINLFLTAVQIKDYLTSGDKSAKIRIEKGTTDKRLVQSYIVTKTNRILGLGGYFFV